MALLLPELYVMLIPTDGGGYRPAVVFPQHISNYEMDANMDLITVEAKIEGGKKIMQLSADGVLYFLPEADKDGRSSWWPENDGVPYHHNLGFCPMVRWACEENLEIATLEGTPVGHSFIYPIIQLATADMQFRSMMSEAGDDHLHY